MVSPVSQQDPISCPISCRVARPVARAHSQREGGAIREPSRGRWFQLQVLQHLLNRMDFLGR